jgi:hypothetical protein
VEPKLKRRIAAGTAGLALVAGAGGTYAATRGGGDDERSAYLNDVARRLDVSPEKLRSALRGAFHDRLDAAVRAGRLTREQADAIKERTKRHGGPAPFLGRSGFGERPLLGGPDGHRGPFRAGVDAASKYLGLSPSRLHARLAAGRSLAQVARARGKSVEGLKDAIADAIRDRLDAAVDAKRLTKAQEQELLSRLDDRIDAIVERRGFGPRRARHRGAWGPHPPF